MDEMGLSFAGRKPFLGSRKVFPGLGSNIPVELSCDISHACWACLEDLSALLQSIIMMLSDLLNSRSMISRKLAM